MFTIKKENSYFGQFSNEEETHVALRERGWKQVPDTTHFYEVTSEYGHDYYAEVVELDDREVWDISTLPKA